ncbi:MAG: hypothetical protein KKE24_01905 [Candidatus Thermoplasmatota archaeon]|nr:hypothetical protein [Candidatus Thermoplasmatota archaeon]
MFSEKGRAIWFLALLSPITAELLSGSSPPIEFFHPFGFLLLLGMYGAGVLLIRELTVIWRKGWATTIVLGFAYAVAEEGVAVKSFFDPGWADLGALSEFGRFAEVNWIWATWLSIFHSMISICLPILIFNLWYPHLREERILVPRRFKLVGAIFLMDLAFAAIVFVSIQDYYPPPLQYVASILTTIVFVLIARELPIDLVSARHELPTWSPWRFIAFGFALILLDFIIASSALSAMSALVTIVTLLMVNAAALLLLQHKLGRCQNSLHKANLALGLVLFFIVLAPIHEVSDGMIGMSVVGLCYLMFMIVLIKKARPRVESVNPF